MKWFEQQTVLANFFSVLYKIPTVKIDRDAFLTEQFEKSPMKHTIVAQGPIAAGVTEKELNKMAKRVINKRTRQATTVSFAAGLPGGIAMAATVPTDTVQFLVNALKMAQELAYLYGYRDFWALQDEARKNDLLLFLGTMLEVKGGAPAMRLLTTQHAEDVAKHMSFSAVERAMYWPILGEIATVIVEKISKKRWQVALRNSFRLQVASCRVALRIRRCRTWASSCITHCATESIIQKEKCKRTSK